MLMPSIFGEDFFDNFFDDFTRPVRSAAKGHGFANMPQVLPQVQTPSMRTDIKETVNEENGSDEVVDDKKYIRRERYYGTCRRAFYVGEDVTQNDIKAKYDNGILQLFVPKIEPVKVEEEKKYINIEG